MGRGDPVWSPESDPAPISCKGPGDHTGSPLRSTWGRPMLDRHDALRPSKMSEHRVAMEPICFAHWKTRPVMDDRGLPAWVSSAGDQSNVICAPIVVSRPEHDVARLPLGICTARWQALRMALKPDDQIPNAAMVDISIRLGDSKGSRIISNVIADRPLKIDSSGS